MAGSIDPTCWISRKKTHLNHLQLLISTLATPSNSKRSHLTASSDLQSPSTYHLPTLSYPAGPNSRLRHRPGWINAVKLTSPACKLTVALSPMPLLSLTDPPFFAVFSKPIFLARVSPRGKLSVRVGSCHRRFLAPRAQGEIESCQSSAGISPRIENRSHCRLQAYFPGFGLPWRDLRRQLLDVVYLESVYGGIILLPL